MRSPADPAVRRFIRKSSIVRIASASPAGNPDIIPLYFVMWRGRIYMSIRSANPIARDIMRSGETALLFHAERGRSGGRALRVRGSARFRTDRRTVRLIALLSARKYFLSPGGAWNVVQNRGKLGLRGRYVGERAGEGGVVEVVPATAEFLRLPG